MKVLGQFLFLLWIAATLGAFGVIFMRVVDRPDSTAFKVVVALGAFLAWCAAQFAAFIFALTLAYCENCAGKPVSARDVVAGSVLLAPTALLVAVAVFLTLKARGAPRAAQ